MTPEVDKIGPAEPPPDPLGAPAGAASGGGTDDSRPRCECHAGKKCAFCMLRDGDV